MDMEDDDEIPDIPDKCPVCKKKVTKSLLLHIRKKESCSSKIDPKMYEHWKQEQNRNNKRKYQSMYVKNGKHRKAQAKYEDKFKSHCKVCEMIVVKPYVPTRPDLKQLSRGLFGLREEYKKYQMKSECKCPPVDRKSYLQTKRQDKAKSRNRERIRCGQDKGNERLKSFRKLCLDCLWCLKRGKIRNAYFNKFHLVEGETLLEYVTSEGEVVYDIEDDDMDEIHSWLSNISGTLLCMVITFQKVILAPKTKWLRAIQEVKSKEEKSYLSDKLYRLIGKLQFYENDNTKDILIPEEFNVSKAAYGEKWMTPETLSEEDEELLVNLLEDIVGEEHVDEDLESLLRISKDNLERALLYTKR